MFKSALSREILRVIVSGCGTYELRKLFKKIEATPTAVRLHVQTLMDDGYIELSQHETNRRCKLVCLTDKGWALMCEYEYQVQRALDKWQQIKSTTRNKKASKGG